ncbi:MAG: glutamine synthetase family protein [Clostridiales bacterium]|jgi:glutamine synthetase|nr:glutamine synthetase family protein [Clostridiales bacterium]MCI2160810.1 glutamine synthetase family protein [Oscillospiraceae bacterium]CAB1247265.1 Glutamine synthetase [Ruminococcaceae bacterium BL-4]MCI1961954.1 glutamine synthetase family protein [Clostridiales bacterium]MCI2022313.1 glutamine synthetase family protein [Clostridiales bacterium]
MNYTRDEVLQYVEENDVKFIRISFCDIFGNQRNVSVMPSELIRAFDLGISFDASMVRGFLNANESDLFLVPDANTLTPMPWRPSEGQVVRLFCNIRTPDGSPFVGDCRTLLRSARAQILDEFGLVCKAGTECEFYLFKTNEDGNPTLIPQDHGTYCDVAPNDKGENVRRQICLSLEEMGMRPESSRHELGPGQNEIDFKYSDILTAADRLVAFKAAVKSIAAAGGLYATFMPKPLENESGSGLHINLSLYCDGENLFKLDPGEHNPIAESFLAGILRRIREITCFLNPVPNSYARFGNFEAPKYVSWSHQNRSQLVRIPASWGSYARMELRSPDPGCSPYLSFALLLYAGMEGIREKLPLCEPENRNLFTASQKELQHLEMLPESLEEALDLAEKSEFVHRYVPNPLLNCYLTEKRKEWEKYLTCGDTRKYEMETYFLRM